MRVRLTDPVFLPDLLAFLRGSDCIAYAAGEAIEVIRPLASGTRERFEIRALLEQWTVDNPRAAASFVD